MFDVSLLWCQTFDCEAREVGKSAVCDVRYDSSGLAGSLIARDPY
jgi:hypothetical protein